ncbi:hypothetical protein NKG94_15350 [Micromonospora sp. M12]
MSDGTGRSGTTQVAVVVGNTRPVVALNGIPNGGLFSWDENLSATATASDAQDGTIPCANVVIRAALGHQEHAHEEGQGTGCGFTVNTGPVHAGPDSVLFFLLRAGYTDRGAAGTVPLTAEKDVTLWPKQWQAEHYVSLHGPQVINASGAEGGRRLGDIQSGEYVRHHGVSLKGITGIGPGLLGQGRQRRLLPVRLTDRPRGRPGDSAQHRRLGQLHRDQRAGLQARRQHPRPVRRVHRRQRRSPARPGQLHLHRRRGEHPGERHPHRPDSGHEQVRRRQRWWDRRRHQRPDVGLHLRRDQPAVDAARRRHHPQPGQVPGREVQRNHQRHSDPPLHLQRHRSPAVGGRHRRQPAQPTGQPVPGHPSSTPTNGRQLQIYDCNGTAAQNWTLP